MALPPTDAGASTAPSKGPRLLPNQGESKAKAPTSSYEDPQAIRTLLERCIEDAARNPARMERDLQDIGNQRLYRGGARNHWIYRPSSNPNTWQERPFDGPDGLPSWIPRCCTNLFANKIDGVVSIFVQSDPAKEPRPATNDDADIAAADVAERAIPVLEDEINYRSLKRQMTQLVCLQDKAALVLYYDTDPKHGKTTLPVFQCDDCASDPSQEMGGLAESWEVDDADGACPSCGGQNINQAMDPRQPGQVMGLDYATGKICATLINSLGFSVPSNATTSNARELAWVLLHNAEAVEEVCREFPDHAEALRNLGGQARRTTAGQSSAFAEELRQMSSPTSANTGRGSGAGKGQPLIVYRLQHDPIEDGELAFPEGLYAVMCGDILLDAGPLPITDRRTGRKRKSILIRTYRAMPGSPYGKPAADDLFPLQIQYNQLETLAFMSAMHHAAPTVFLPTTVTLEDDLTGQPGATVRYRTMDPSAKPSLEQGSGVHPTVYELLDRIERKMDQLSGLNGVLQGSRPEGGKATAFEVQALQERGMAAFRSPLEESVDFERELDILLLDIARESMWVPRFQKILGDNGQWEVQQFLGSDLSGNVDIVIEPMSAWPKSPMLQDARLGRATELGVLLPGQDPEVAAKVLAMLNLDDLKPSLGTDKKQVARELDRWRAATMPQEILPPNLAIINPAIHLFLKSQFLKTEQAEQLSQANPPLFEAMVQHVTLLQMALAPPPMAAPPGKPGPPSGDAVNAAVSSGALVPEGAQQKPNPLEHAIQGGALQPEQPAPPPPAGPSIDQLMSANVLTPAPQEPAR